MFVPFSGPSGCPRDLRIISRDDELSTVTLGWSEVDCQKQNGLLLGYECAIYFSSSKKTELVDSSANTYTISLSEMPSIPIAFSVAALNEAGFGAHSPSIELGYFESSRHLHVLH